MKIEGKIHERINFIDSSNNINEYLNIKLQQEKKLEEKNINTKNINNNIYNTIKIKATIINNDQRDIQDKISLIQEQEEKIQSIENTLKQTKSEYLQAIQNEKNEELKQKIKVRQFIKQIDKLKSQTKDKKQTEEDIETYKKEYIEDENKIIDKISELLKRINSTKTKLSQYKNELITVSQDIESNKKKIEAKESEFRKQIDDSDYIINGITINTSNYVDLRGNISTGIIIDIYI